MQLVSEALHARGKVLIAEGDVAGGRTLLEGSLGINREIAITAGFTMIESAVHNGIPKKGSTGSNRTPRWSPWGDSGGLVKEYATRCKAAIGRSLIELAKPASWRETFPRPVSGSSKVWTSRRKHLTDGSLPRLRTAWGG